jgi:F-type H+-transporting ATPase subunit epsilon
MELIILSPQNTECKAEVKSVSLPGENGQFTVLRDHASLISNLMPGTIAYQQTDGSHHEYEIRGGVADIMNNTIRVCII